MKTVIKIFFCSLLVLSCSSSDSDNNQLNILIQGRWQLTSLLYYEDTDPNQVYEHPVENGYSIEFFRHGNFISIESINPLITTGDYKIYNDSIVTLKYKNVISTNIIKKKIISCSDLELTLEGFSEDGSPCIGGCGERFQKITDTSSN